MQKENHFYCKFYELKNGDTVIVGGANIGTFTYVASKAVGKEGRVIAIEPNPTTLKILRKNVGESRLDNVTIVPKALWDHREKITLFGSGMGCSFIKKEGPQVEAEADSLTNIVEELKIGKVDFIKINVGGAEIKALEGAKKVLECNDVALAIAAYYVVDGRPTHEKIVPWLKQLGFDIHLVKGTVYAAPSRSRPFVKGEGSRKGITK